MFIDIFCVQPKIFHDRFILLLTIIPWSSYGLIHYVYNFAIDPLPFLYSFMSCLIIQEYSMLTVFLDCDTWVLEPSRYTRY